jgi:hypothetical protein
MTTYFPRLGRFQAKKGDIFNKKPKNLIFFRPQGV